MIDFQHELNESQYQAVTFDAKPLLILAGAGSGKTRALTYRAAYFVQEKHLSPHQILLLTFTNKAAGEMQSRLRNLVGVDLPFAGTFHSFCAKFLRREGHHIGLPIGYVIYDDADQIDLVKHFCKQLDLPKNFQPRGILTQIGQAKHELLTPVAYSNLAQGEFQQAVAEVYIRYQRQLHENSAVDFDDLLLKTVDLLRDFPDVRDRYQRQFTAVLIDEYQDTNRAQYLIAKYLSEFHHNITVVGDASQSIYRWRGADYRNLEYLNNDFPELTVVKLEQNYRSTKHILDAAHAVISHNRTHPILALWTQETGGDPLSLLEANDERHEAAFIVDSLRNDPNLHSAILYRTNAQSRAIEEALIRAGIPYTLIGGTKFYERKEIKDILSYLRLVVNPKDTVSLNRIEKIGKRRAAAFLAKVKTLKAETTTSAELFDQVLKLTNYMDLFDPKNEADLSRIENIKELRSVATQFDSLTDFLENVALVENSSISKSDKNENLLLMTIHASKGLEFDQVFLIGLEEGLFPHSRSLLDPAELEEERRLCYVALTRARKKIFLSYARDRLYFGGYNHGVVSRFVAEIPEHLLKPVLPYQTFSFAPKKPTKPLDDDLLEKFLADEIDIDTLLTS